MNYYIPCMTLTPPNIELRLTRRAYNNWRAVWWILRATLWDNVFITRPVFVTVGAAASKIYTMITHTTIFGAIFIVKN